MVAKTVYLGFVIGNIMLMTAFRFQHFSISAFQLFRRAQDRILQ
jgi:hypothetical protein